MGPLPSPDFRRPIRARTNGIAVVDSVVPRSGLAHGVGKPPYPDVSRSKSPYRRADRQREREGAAFAAAT